MGKQIEITAGDGGKFQAYCATPPGGKGPGIVLLQDAFGVTRFLRETADRLAEDGYLVLVPELFWRIEPGLELSDADSERAMGIVQRFDFQRAAQDVHAAIAALRSLPEHAGGIGAVGYGLGGRLAVIAAGAGDVDCAVIYYGVRVADNLAELEKATVPVGFHYGAEDALCAADISLIRKLVTRQSNLSLWIYPGADHAFADQYRPNHNPNAAELAYIRTLSVLRPTLGPKFDLEAQWDAHMYHEFVTRDADAVLDTMVDDPYVNITSTVMGGVGHDMLLRFYKEFFCAIQPKDMKGIPVSRTVGVNRIVDELILCFTHDCELPWMLPGIPPTGRYIEVAMVIVVSFRGGKIYNEHIYFDQASVLVQAGLLDAKSLPVAGAEIAAKLRDKSIEPNKLLKGWA